MASVTNIEVSLYAIGCFFVLIKLIFSRHGKRVKMPPGPRGLPLIGSLHELGTLPHQSLARMATKYGPLFSIHLGRKVGVVASLPETAMEFLKNRDDNFASRPTIRAAQVIIPHAEEVFQMELSGARRLQASQHVREEEVAHMVRAIAQDHESPLVDLRTHLGIATSNIISRMTLNRRMMASGGEALQEMQQFRAMVEEMIVCLGEFNPVDFDIAPLKWLDFRDLEGRFQRLKCQMDVFDTDIVTQHLQRRRGNSLPEQEKDFVDTVLDLQDADSDITDDHVKATIWAAFVAGTMPSMLTIEWAMAELIRNPHVQEKAQAELDAVVGTTRAVRESDIPALKYLQALVREVFRLHPTATLLLPHQSIEACTVMGYDIPARTRVFVNVWAIGRDPSVWENPLEFNPERFLSVDSESRVLSERDQLLQTLAFGSGRRLCPGMAMGTRTVQIVLASLVHAFAWSPAAPGPQVELTEGPGLLCGLAQPLRAVAKPKLSVSDVYISPVTLATSV